MPSRRASLATPSAGVPRLIAVVAIVWLAAACGTPSPSAPSDTAGANEIAGVVWFDDGDGQIGDDEQAAVGLRVRAGDQSAPFADLVMTDDRGGFVVPLPDLGQVPLDQLDVFVEATVQVDGPDGGPIDVAVRQSAKVGTVVAVAVPAIEPCDASIEAVLDGSPDCGQAMLPDLVPLIESFGQSPSQPVGSASVRFDVATTPGTRLLRFASATANLGAGPLHMIPDAAPDADRLGTWQRIWTDQSSYLDRPTGEFVFHEGHDHFHLEGFERYRLLTLDGDVAAGGDKVSFCLIDALPAVDEPMTRGLGVFLDVVCEQAGDQQALNPGWADYYGAGLDDQWIDITGVVPGDYLVEIVADPDDLLLEADETNNRATFPVTIPAG